MTKYRKSDQYYIDQYDRITIERLKDLEMKIIDLKKTNHLNLNLDENQKSCFDFVKFEIKYHDFGTVRAKNKEKSIQELILSDERKDRLIQSTPIPENIRCKTCFELMEFELHSFKGIDEDLIFFFNCRNGHFPKKMIYSNGSEYCRVPRSCLYCGGKIESKTKKFKSKIILTDTCMQCDKVEIMELDNSIEKILPINELDRKKYCDDFIGKRSFSEDLQAIYELYKSLELIEKNEIYNFDHVKQLNITQLEEMISDNVEKSGFIKIQFEKPKVGRFLILEFSVQDSTNRDEKGSLKMLQKIIETALFPTNWRLILSSISYKLGFLSGELKGCSLKEDLIKIGKEIDKKQKVH